MELYLLSCENLLQHADEILPRLPQGRQAAFLRSHSPLTLGAGLLLAEKLGVHADEDLYFGPQGKPHLSAGGPSFSLSHSGQHVLLGIDDGRIGVDLEKEDRPAAEALRRRVCLPQERGVDFLTVYTRKECAMKLTGLGFSLPLHEIDTTRDFVWDGQAYAFLTLRRWGYVISVLSGKRALPPLQLLTAEELL